MRSGDLAVKIGDGGDHGRPSLGRRVMVGPVIAARVEAQVRGSVQSRNAAIAQIGFHDSARNRPRHGEQAPRRFRRPSRRPRVLTEQFRFWFRSWQAEKAPSLIHHVVEVDEAAAPANDVEQIAMIGRRAIGLMCS
jgi:hypothetical protein